MQGFNQNGRDRGTGLFVAVDQGFEGLQIVVGEIIKPGHHGLKTLVVLGLTGGGDRRERAAMEAGCCREDHRLFDAAPLMAVLARQLDRGLIGFGAGIAEEDAVGTAVAHQPAGQLFLFRNPIEVGHMLEPSQLLAQSPLHGPVAVAQGAGGNASNSIQVAPPLGVLDPAALSLGQSQRETAVGVHDGGGMGAGGLEPPRPVAG